jgi:hypothetical protein
MHRTRRGTELSGKLIPRSRGREAALVVSYLARTWRRRGPITQAAVDDQLLRRRSGEVVATPRRAEPRAGDARLLRVARDTHVLPRLACAPAPRARSPDCRRASRRTERSRSQPDLRPEGDVLLQGVLERAVEWERIPANPARAVRKPPLRREHAAARFRPSRWSTSASTLLDRGLLRDAVLVSLLAYAGPARRGARAHVGPHPRADDSRGARGRAGRARDDEDRPHAHRAPAHPIRGRPRRVVNRPRSAGRGVVRLPQPKRRCLERCGLAELASTDLRARSARGRARRGAGPATCGTRSGRFFSWRGRTSSRSRARPAIRRV